MGLRAVTDIFALRPPGRRRGPANELSQDSRFLAGVAPAGRRPHSLRPAFATAPPFLGRRPAPAACWRRLGFFVAALLGAAASSGGPSPSLGLRLRFRSVSASASPRLRPGFGSGARVRLRLAVARLGLSCPPVRPCVVVVSLPPPSKESMSLFRRTAS